MIDETVRAVIDFLPIRKKSTGVTINEVSTLFQKRFYSLYCFIRVKAKENQGARTDILATLPESKPVDTRKELSKVASVSGQKEC